MAQSNAATAVQNLFKTPELKEKILFTLLCLLVYRIGAHVTAPGINPQAIADFIDSQKNGGGLLGLYNLFTGGQLARATVFALGIMPYISARIFQQIAQARDAEGREDVEGRRGPEKDQPVVALRHGGPRGGAGVGLRDVRRVAAGRGGESGLRFRMSMTFFLTTGAIFVMWLGEQITERGIGNGASLMIFFSIVERIWPGIFQSFQFVSTGAIGAFSLVVLMIMMVGGGRRRWSPSRWRRAAC